MSRHVYTVKVQNRRKNKHTFYKILHALNALLNNEKPYKSSKLVRRKNVNFSMYEYFSIHKSPEGFL